MRFMQYIHTFAPSVTLLQVTMLGSLSHPNIMRFMAISLDPPMIVMQYYSYGSLFSLLQVRVGSEGMHTYLVGHTATYCCLQPDLIGSDRSHLSMRFSSH